MVDAANQAQTALARLSGAVEHIVYADGQSGFLVCKLKTDGKVGTDTLTGYYHDLQVGELLECTGQWVNDPKFGRQFRAETLRSVPPSTLAGIEKYLGSGLVRGVGPKLAKQLVAAFGEAVFNVIENEPERLKALHGVGKKRMQALCNAWGEQQSVRDIMVFLQSHGIGTARAARIYKLYGDQAVAKVRANPYQLAYDVHGMGFQTADELAQQLGIAQDADIRARAGVRYVLSEQATRGHCALPEAELCALAVKLLGIKAEIVQAAINAEVQAGHVVAEVMNQTPHCYIAALYRAEVSVAEHLQRLRQGTVPWSVSSAEEATAWAMQQTQQTLSPSQKDALATLLQAKVAVMTGGPGVGKTTLVRQLIVLAQRHGIAVALCAPTGRAAKRLSESTGLVAKTIHRLLEFDPVSPDRFKRNSDNPLVTDYLIIDESSMVDLVLMQQLLQAVPDHAAILLVGDIDQLPSVGPGMVLADLIAAQILPVVRLTEIFRQAAMSQIIVNAHQVNQGRLPQPAPASDELSDFYVIHADTPEAIQKKCFHVVMERIPKRFNLDPIAAIQILTPMQKGPLGARALNLNLQKALNGQAEPKLNRMGWTFSPGDKVMQLVNNYDKEVFNGDLGLITHIDMAEQVLHIQFDQRVVVYQVNELDELSLAYATSIHKSQGSEYPAVVIPLSTQHFTMLERHLLYTAITRGKQLVVLIAQPRALAIAVRTQKSGQRITHLAERLRQLSSACGDKLL